MDLPKRKQIRLPDYDYSAPGAYFVTICTRDRRCILSDITVGAAISRPPELHLTAYGEIVESAIKSIPAIYPAVFIDNYVIMPNHVHLILRINTDNDGRQIAAPLHNPPMRVQAWPHRFVYSPRAADCRPYAYFRYWANETVGIDAGRIGSLAKILSRACDPKQERLSGDLGIYRQQSRTLGQRSVLYRRRT